MHEATVALAILKRAASASEERARSDEDSLRLSGETEPIRILEVSKVVVRIGEFRNIDSESLSFSFDALRKEFACTENAELEIKPVEAIALCSISKHEFHPLASSYFSCTICGGGIDCLIAGNELDIVNIELEHLRR